MPKRVWKHWIVLGVGFLTLTAQMQSGGGGGLAVPRGFVDVTDSGASPADSVSNSVYIQNAIDEAFANGAGGIYIPPGEWIIAGDGSNSVDINTLAGVDVVGAGKNSTTIRFADNSVLRTMLRLDRDSNVTIRDITLDGNFSGRDNEATTEARTWGILINGPATGVVIRDVIIKGVTHGIRGGGSGLCGTIIEGCDISIQSTASTINNGNTFVKVSGIRLPNGTCGSWIRNTYISGGYPDTTATNGLHGYGIEVGGEDTRMEGVWISNFSHGSPVVATSAGGIGVNIESTAKRTSITDLSLTKIGWYGIAVAGSTVAITGLQVRNVDGWGIYLHTGAYAVSADINSSYANVDSANVGGPGLLTGLDAGLFVGARDGVDALADTLFIKRVATDAVLEVVK